MIPPHQVATARQEDDAESGAEVHAPTEWWLDRDIALQLYPLARRAELSGDDLDREIEALEVRHGIAVYAELIFLFTNLKLDPLQARNHWLQIRRHQRTLGQRLSQAPDVRVVLLSYFLDVHRRFERPKIVEMDWVERTAASAYLDELTGLPNSRFLREQLDRELGRSLFENTPLSLLLIDADRFKQVNDTHGHEAGNEVLRALARVMRQHVPERACLARYGGEEFVVMIPATPKHEAAEIAERVRAAVEAERFFVNDHTTELTITVSMGLATCPADARSAEALRNAADTALYRAKHDGRNRVGLFGESSRSFGRHRLKWQGSLRALDAPIVVRGVEVGDGGLVFRADRSFEADALVEISVELPGEPAVMLAGRVVWSRAAGDDTWESAVRVVEQGIADRHRLAVWLADLRQAS